ncbi:hypothetical protein FB451DRAFT_639523, partial [Mycena latifolia]
RLFFRPFSVCIALPPPFRRLLPHFSCPSCRLWFFTPILISSFPISCFTSSLGEPRRLLAAVLLPSSRVVSLGLYHPSSRPRYTFVTFPSLPFALSICSRPSRVASFPSPPCLLLVLPLPLNIALFPSSSPCRCKATASVFPSLHPCRPPPSLLPCIPLPSSSHSPVLLSLSPSLPLPSPRIHLHFAGRPLTRRPQVFRNPVLGLRNDRAPKFIRPFASCKSAKIMLDPVTGVSRGYGFVRFTDEADQQRALIEMHGLYCLSRPMRISPATAKFKPPPPDLAQLTSLPPPTASTTANPAPASVATPGFPGYTSVVSVTEQAQAQGQQGQQQAPPQPQTQSVSAPIAVPYYAPQQQQTPEYGGGAQEYFAQFPASQQQQQQPTHQQQPAAQQQQQQDPTAAEWKHHAHARAILGNLIGPNGEQLTSTDPYNTTVFVGGLSPLVGEETLRTFFVPFGEIHYVKVPVGKHCGFVQFVRKADAERAIEKMQGFPVGGSRIRLSWGRSQYKAAQAAAQAAQAAALQAAASAPAQPATPTAQPNAGLAGITPAVLSGMTQEQAIMLLQKFGVPGYVAAPNAYAPPPAAGSGYAPPANANTFAAPSNVNGGGYAAPPNANYVPTPSGNNNNGADSYRSSFHSSSPSNSNLGEAYLGAAANANAGASNTPQPQFTEENLKVRRDDGPFGYTQQRAYEVAGPAGSTFSPFSPDPNQQQNAQQQQGLYTAAELLGTRRDSYSAALPHPSKAYAPGFFPVAPVLQTPASAGGGKMAVGGGASPTRGYGGGFAGSPPAFQINRYQAHPQAQTQPISRPNSGSAARSSGERERERAHEEFDSMHDLNGTLASLDLDRERELGLGDRPWSLKSPIPESSSEESTSSGGSVQFRMKRTPSP